MLHPSMSISKVLALSTTDAAALEVSPLNICFTNARQHGDKLSGIYIFVKIYRPIV